MLTREQGHRLGADVLRTFGYSESEYVRDYPVWLGGTSLGKADFVAFGRSSPHDMSTATAVVEIASNGASVENHLEIARTLAAPLLVSLSEEQLVLQRIGRQGPPEIVARLQYDKPSLQQWSNRVGPRQLLEAKLGAHQLALFPIDVQLLAAARERSEQRLSPLVDAALRTAAEMSSATLFEVPGSVAGERLHQQAARIVVGALTALTFRDKEGLQDLTSSALADASQQRHSQYFGWLQRATDPERETFEAIIRVLGESVNYASLDPRILASVYESSLVTDAHRKALGTHYTPPGLARRMLEALPVESIRPESRLVMDPTCGSGGLLLAGHDRIRDLLPSEPRGQRFQHAAGQLRGYDRDAFAVELAQLSLLLNSYPAGNGWHVSQKDVLRMVLTDDMRPSIVVANPPWRNTNTAGARRELADSFLSWMVDALLPGGLLAVVLPAGWLNSRSSRASRSYLNKNCKILEVWRLPEDTFESSNAAPAVILSQKRGVTDAPQVGRVYRRIVRRTQLDHFYTSGSAEEVTHHVETPADVGAPIVSGPLVKLSQSRDWSAIGYYADVITGPQPLPGIPKTRPLSEPTNALYLTHGGKLPQFSEAPDDAIVAVNFPGDFQNGSRRGRAGLGVSKILVSAARAPNNPWRLKAGLDRRGVIVRNSLHMVIPEDDTLLYGIMAFLGSGFASAWIDETVPDRNISTADIRAIPVPRLEEDWIRLSDLGRRLADAEFDARRDLIRELDGLVFTAMRVDRSTADQVRQRLSGFLAPEHVKRYEHRTRATGLEEATQAVRTTFGATRESAGGEVNLFIPGLTEEPGEWVRPPVRMTGWMLQPGATFSVHLSEAEELDEAVFSYQSESWLSDDELVEEVRSMQESYD